MKQYFPYSHRQKKKNVGTISDTISTIMESVRDFAHFTLKDVANNTRTVCAISSDDKYVNVVTYSGLFFRYSIPPNGGECTLKQKDSLWKTTTTAQQTNGNQK